jgi:hypothetical protein
MAKIDRLGWAAGFSFTTHGLRVGLRVSDASALPALVERLPPEWKRSASPLVPQIYSLVVGGEGSRPGLRRLSLAYANSLQIARTGDVGQAVQAIEDDLRSYVAEWARRWVFVHAAAVAWEGRAIVIPGRAGSGKSRLVRALARAGATPCSEHYAVLDRRGRVRSCAGSRRPLPIALVVVAPYRPGARWRARSVSSGDGALALLGNAVLVRQRPQAVLPVVSRAVAGASVVKGARGEAEAAAAEILALARAAH